MKIVTASYYGHPFELELERADEYYFEGKLLLTSQQKVVLQCLHQEHAEEDWYLDDNGNRLGDEELFEKSPWTIIENGVRRKAVARMENHKTGEIRLAMQPWFRIGDWH